MSKTVSVNQQRTYQDFLGNKRTFSNGLRCRSQMQFICNHIIFFSSHLRGFDEIESRKAFWYANHSVTMKSLTGNKSALFIAKFEI